MAKHLCDLCNQVTESIPVLGQNGSYMACQNCLDQIPPRELCRIIGHRWAQVSRHEHASSRFISAFDDITERCTRCDLLRMRKVYSLTRR